MYQFNLLSKILGTRAFQNAFFGSGTGPIFFERFECSGDEDTLLECASRPIGIHDCDHSHDAGVQCIGTFNFALYHLF